MPMKHVGSTTTIPFPSFLLPADAFLQLIRTVKASLTDILVDCDASCSGIDAADYVPGWERPLVKQRLSAIIPDKPFTSDLVLSISDYFGQVRRALHKGLSGPEALQLLLRINLMPELAKNPSCDCKVLVFGMVVRWRTA